MGQHYSSLSMDERTQMGRSTSTLTREFARHVSAEHGYRPAHAQELSRARRAMS